MSRPLRLEYAGALYHVTSRVSGVRSCLLPLGLSFEEVDLIGGSLDEQAVEIGVRWGFVPCDFEGE